MLVECLSRFQTFAVCHFLCRIDTLYCFASKLLYKLEKCIKTNC
nr:MAG TPA: hypothetical protein [Crassvirales sp.]DAG98579.1 MAG TPA: hypothetical protein [Crassvirales sp.]